MTILVRSWIGATLLGFSIVLMVSPTMTYAQGSAGGSIGNDDKAVSGSRPEPRAVERPARRSRSDADDRSSSRKGGGGGGGGGGSFDGAWIVNAVGVTCSGTSSNAVVVTSGRIIGNNVTSGKVSPNGSVYATGGGGSSGLTNVTTGAPVGPQRLWNVCAVRRLPRPLDRIETVGLPPAPAAIKPYPVRS